MLVSFRPLARLIAAVLCTSLAVVLIGANAPTFFSSPTLVIFPLRTTEGTDPTPGSGYATTLGTALGALGGVNVVMGNSATAPADYLRVAKLNGGDFYFMGSIAPPVRNAATVIEQIVSTRSGVVVWSGTAYITGQDDILNQAPVVKQALFAYTTRAYAQVLNSPPPKPLRVTTPAPTPAPKKGATVASGGAARQTGPGTDGPPLKLPNEAYGFSSKPTAPPKIYASSSRPSRFVVLNFVGNNVPPRVRDYAVNSLVTALKRHGQTAAEGDPAYSAHRLPSSEVCTGDRRRLPRGRLGLGIRDRRDRK